MTYTPKEMELIHAYGFLMEKHQWLREHPDKTRRDYQRAWHDGSLVEWRKAKFEKDFKAQKRAYLRDHGKPLPEHECGLSDAELAKLYRWRAQWHARRRS